MASYAERLYSPEELAGLPESVTGFTLGCGNPTAIAELKPGEVVLDLGSGGGIDCFLAAQKVGATGKVIGLDMTQEMIKLARRNAKKMGVTNVDFRYGEMEEMPIPDESVDVIISNCVINLSPDKDAVFTEAYRVLRPGGRLAISDIVTNGELPEFIRKSEDAWYSCVSGALDEAVYLDKIEAAGFTDIEVTSRTYFDLDSLDVGKFLAVLAESLSLDELRASLNNKIVSIKVRAHKPQ
jgi:SAM-dependent methyltransferase